MEEIMGNDNKPGLTEWIEVLNTSTYSLNAIKKICYQFSTSFSVKLEKIDEENVKIFFKFNEPHTSEKIDLIISNFYQALLDQDLREIVSRETEGVRNLILAHAFSKTTLIDPE
ncbi:TPA: His-Xaa-Ser system protein HxsD [Legionella pneumophila subsp. pneumophila]|nr:His-Xaa-Ser system protein HxsD [Legionella pneumophila]RYX29264.1 His-Xaa-Ser system protein HxsD [Legionella pneumophila]HAT8820393.1 His-Xaa-Ser system protein HxsD [Legionella pneumophila subsp. pneumophila]HAT9681167.1 His-Xaa-Ser system protein HxsD [Legionella pneumophila subsp. pneumophila]HAU1968941.1 His-Xaa-Ser system protein HxsD [Legionella pneumophila]